MRKSLQWISAVILSLFIAGNPAFSQQHFGSNEQEVSYQGSRTGNVIYDQMDAVSGGWIAAMEMTNSENKLETSFAADDFIVPEGETWNVAYMKLVGGYPYSEETSDTLNVFFYENNEGVPGTEIYSYLDITNFNQILIDEVNNMYEFEITLPETVALSEGQYWMCVQVKTDNNVQGQWVWYLNGQSTVENVFHWKNPLDGFGTGSVDWTGSDWILWWPPYNLNFALYGEAVTDDMTVLAIKNPVTSPDLTSSEAITVSIKNEGSEPQSGFDITYTINDGAPVTENIGTTLIGPNQIYEYTFNSTADLSVAGPYEIVVSTNLNDDLAPENDSYTSTVYNMGTIYQAADTSSITACSGTFVDPGGLSGGIMSGMASLTTIYPETEGDRVRLDFLSFDPGWCDAFHIYDGETTDAPLLGFWQNEDNPGVVSAMNPSGALTIDFVASGWDDGPGWEAYISCFTPAEDDFAVTALNSSATVAFENSELTFSATVLNFGSVVQSKEVTFTANGTTIGSVTTGDLLVGSDTTLSVTWTPTTPAEYVIEASVIDDEGAEDNNSQAIDLSVLAFDAFFEDFENTAFPPEEWTSTGGWYETTGAFEGEKAAQIYVPFEAPDGDTIISPRLIIEEGATLKFAAMGSPWWPGEMKLHWMDGSTGEWHFLTDVALEQMMWTEFEIDLSAAAGEGNYIGFHAHFTDPWAWGGQVTLDFVQGEGIDRYFNNNDIKIQTLEDAEFVRAYEETVFNVLIKNNGINEQSAGTYSVKLMQKTEAGDIELTSIDGQYINTMQEINYEIPYTFEEIGLVELYALVDFPADENLDNNNSNNIESIVLPGGSETVEITVEEGGWPYNTPEMPVYFYYENSLSQNIYAADEVEKEGLITAISYSYNFVEDIADAPIRIWMGITDTLTLNNPDYTGYMLPSTDLTLVFEGNLDYKTGEHNNLIQLETPFYYDNTQNLVIMTEKTMETWYDYMNSFVGHGCPNWESRCAHWHGLLDVLPNPEDPASMEGNIQATSTRPDITFVFNNDISAINGYIYDEVGNPIVDATVTIDGLGLQVETDAEGRYEFEQVPAASYNVTASAFSYYDNTQEINVFVGSASNVDFTLTAIPTFAINGLVVGSNDETVGLQGGSVILSGYNTYETTTTPGGHFDIAGIYNFDVYTLEIWVPGYEVYTAQIEVSDNTDLGTIILNELYISAFNAITSDLEDQVAIVWNTPNQLAEGMIIEDDGEHDNGYCAEPYEEVSLGNLFENDEVITITAVDLFWAEYLNGTAVPVRVDIYDGETEALLASSQSFNSGLGEDWISVDVPNLTLDGDYFVMVYWDGTASEPSSYLGTDLSEGNLNNAYYHYPNSNFYKFETLIGYPSNFMIRPNIMTEATRGDDRSVLSYNVYKGMADNVAGVSGWDKINNFPVTETSFNDTEWPPVYSDSYMYAVEAIYTEGNSEVVFSTPVHYQEPILPVENLVATDSLGYTIGWALIEWDTPQDANPIGYNIYLNNNTTPEAMVTGTSYTFHDLAPETYAVGVTAVYNSGESAAEVVSFTITIDVDGMDAANISAYPNPATDYVILDIEGSCNVEIFNTVGDIIKSIESYTSGSEINIEGLEAGAYFFRITNNENAIIKKVIVQ